MDIFSFLKTYCTCLKPKASKAPNPGCLQAQTEASSISWKLAVLCKYLSYFLCGSTVYAHTSHKATYCFRSTWSSWKPTSAVYPSWQPWLRWGVWISWPSTQRETRLSAWLSGAPMSSIASTTSTCRGSMARRSAPAQHHSTQNLMSLSCSTIQIKTQSELLGCSAH